LHSAADGKVSATDPLVLAAVSYSIRSGTLTVSEECHAKLVVVHPSKFAAMKC